MSRRAVAVLVLMVGNALFTAMTALVLANLGSRTGAIGTSAPSLAALANPTAMGVILAAFDVVLWALLFWRLFKK